MKVVCRVYVQLLLFLIISISCQNQSANQRIKHDVYAAQICFVDSVHHFGKLKESSEPVSYSFYYKNVGNVPAVILHVTPSCHCTSAVFDTAPVKPGDTGKITVLFDSKKTDKGFFNKQIKVRINSSNSYTLSVRGQVE